MQDFLCLSASSKGSSAIPKEPTVRNVQLVIELPDQTTLSIDGEETARSPEVLKVSATPPGSPVIPVPLLL